MDLQRRRLYSDRQLHAGRSIALVLALTGLFAARAGAQDPTSIEVTPLRVELKISAGGTHTQAVTLKNDASKAIRARARVDDWYLSKDGTPQFKLADPADPFSAAAWIRLNPTEQIIEPGVTATVRFTTTVPAGTREGGYRCAVMFEFDSPSAELATRSRGVAFRPRVATLLYATVGNPVPAVELTDLDVRFNAAGIPEVVATLKNTSSVHVRTKGTVTILGAEDGKVIRNLSVPNVPVLPQSEREVAIVTSDEQSPPLPPGRYRVEVKMDVGLPTMLVGETNVEVVAKRIK